MNVSDWIVEWLAERGVRHAFGYQGTMVSYFVDSLLRSEKVSNHVLYNEQGASLAACGLASATGGLGFCYATSGPGAVNLLQGVANAHFDSVPLLAITGQVNTSEYAGTDGLRQRAFQEADVSAMASPITKSATSARSPAEALFLVARGAALAVSGRPGAVLVDVPMDIQRAEVSEEDASRWLRKGAASVRGEELLDPAEVACSVVGAVERAERPLVLLGGGAGRSAGGWLEWCEGEGVPCVTTLLGRGVIPSDCRLNLGFVGVYGHRVANLAAHRADLIVSVGAGLTPRQLRQGEVSAHVMRIDVEPAEALRAWPGAEYFRSDAGLVSRSLVQAGNRFRREEWRSYLEKARSVLYGFDESDPGRMPNGVVRELSELCEGYPTVSVDVGQHMMWVAQSFRIRKGQRLLFSGGHGAMGFALPAAIGAAIGLASPALCVAGDGGIQMNLQELQAIASSGLPVKVVVLNNESLGLIVDAQDAFLGSRYVGSSPEGGYSAPDFSRIAAAYGLSSVRASWDERGRGAVARELRRKGPGLIQIDLGRGTRNHPKAYMGDALWNQSPNLPEGLQAKLR